MRERTLAGLGVACATLLFLLQGSCLLDRPGLNAGELSWGPLKAAIYRLMFAVRPEQVWNLRWPMLIVGAATVAAGCMLVRRMAGWWGFAAAAILLATDPTLIFSSRLDSADLVLPRFFLVLSLILFFRFWKTASRWYLAAACAAFGFACTNAWAAPTVIAIDLAAVTAFRKEIGAAAGKRNLWPTAAGILPLLLVRGAPAVRSTPVDPIQVLDGSAWFGYAVREQPGTWGVGPQNWIQQHTVAFAHAFGWPRHDMLGVGLLAAFLAGNVILLRSKDSRRALRFSLTIPLAGYIALVVTGSHAWSVLAPFAAIAIAVTLSVVARYSVHGSAAAVAILAALGLSNLAVTANLYANALLYGGTAPWTEATYRLADDLDVRDARDLCVLTPATGAVLQFLRHGHAHLVPAPAGEDALYVSGTDDESVRKVDEIAKAAHRSIHPIRYIQDFQGRSVFVLYRME